MTDAEFAAALAELRVLTGCAERIDALLARRLLSRSRLASQAAAASLAGRPVRAQRLLQALGCDLARERGHAPPLPADWTAPLRPGIALWGIFHAEAGVSQSARLAARALATTGIAHSAHNYARLQHTRNDVAFPADEALANPFDTVLIHANADTLLHYRPTFPFQTWLRRRRIGYFHWELPVFPAIWADAFAPLHEVWAPSVFVARLIAAATTLPVRVVPHGVDTAPADREAGRAAFGWRDDEFVFLTAFDSNSFPARKNPAAVLRAYRDAFPDRDQAPRLVIKLHGSGGRSELGPLLAEARAHPRVSVVDEVLSPERLRQLQAGCDAFVSLHRSEGFGLNLIECMALGKPCVATGFSGNLDFMSPSNSLLVPASPRVVEPAEYLHGQGQWWAEPSHDAAVEAMRRLAGEPAYARALGEVARRDVSERFSFAAVGKTISAAWRGDAGTVFA